MSEYITGESAIIAYQTAVELYGEKDIPKPVCERCQSDTGYNRIKLSGTKAEKAVLALFQPSRFTTENDVYLALSMCPDCVGFSDGWDENQKKSNFGTPAMYREYLSGHIRGLQAITKRKKEEEKSRIRKVEENKQYLENIRQEVKEELRPQQGGFGGY